MLPKMLVRAALAAVFALLLLPAASALAQSPAQTRFEGSINDYTDTANPAGAWHVTGDWSAQLKGASGRVSVAIGLSMMRAGSGASPHTHHVFLDGVATPLANGSGYAVQGLAIITGNGAVAGFSGSPVTVEFTGNAAVFPSNVRVIFSDAAAGHFGPDPIDGVVRVRP